ncbi:hypothetical protein BJ912DRAFT_921906 [Pholiota molesta]|nr:hypothetical protein BJ912DRAFT_921906 [Pholiota molesta]
MSLEVIQNQFTLGAIGLNKHFTMHSLQQGGAQYQLMFAPLGERWSLSIIHWWGGWAIGEQVNTLMKYLIDSLQSYESSHNDALCPTRVDRLRTFLGEGNLIGPATKQDIHTLAKALVSAKVMAPQSEKCSLGTRCAGCHPPNAASHLWLPSAPTYLSPPVEINAGVLNQLCLLPMQAPPRVAEPVERPVASATMGRKQRKSHKRDSLPIPGIIIPNLSCRKGLWRDAVVQWEEGDPTIGMMALKDWPKEMYTRMVQEKVSIKLNHNDVAFENLYGNANSQSALINVIRDNMQMLGLSITPRGHFRLQDGQSSSQ